MLDQGLGPLLTSRPCDIPLGGAEMMDFARVGKGKGLGTGAVNVSLCPGSVLAPGLPLLSGGQVAELHGLTTRGAGRVK